MPRQADGLFIVTDGIYHATEYGLSQNEISDQDEGQGNDKYDRDTEYGTGAKAVKGIGKLEEGPGIADLTDDNQRNSDAGFPQK